MPTPEAQAAMNQSLENRCAIITGASRGLGFEIAKKYLEAGASLMICARNEAQLHKASLELKELAGSGQSVIALPADISKSRGCGGAGRPGAAVFRTSGRPGQQRRCGEVPAARLKASIGIEWVQTIEINLLGSVLLSRAILPHFKQAGRGKIIQLSGGGATNPLPNLSAYAASKAAVVRFVETLAEETRHHPSTSMRIAPGALNTRMLDEFIAAGPERIGAAFHERCVQQKRDGGVPASPRARAGRVSRLLLERRHHRQIDQCRLGPLENVAGSS